MQILDFYKRVLPSAGRFCLVAPSKKHYWYDTKEELAEATAKRTASEADWYFGTNGYDDSEGRKGENVVSAKSLRLDLDAGEKKMARHGEAKIYANARAAAAHLQEFITWSGLNPTLIVLSGEGLHVYYCFDEDFPSVGVWTHCAESLQRLCDAFGLKTDRSVTCDAARILRPVGSLHWNSKNVAVIRAAAEDLPFATLSQVLRDKKEHLPAAKPARMAINADLNGPPPIYTPGSIVKAAGECAYVREMLDAQGDVGYDDWAKMLPLIKYSSEGEDFAVEWSSGHPDADEDITREKLSTFTKGPTTCAKIASAHCASCAHHGKVGSPIVLGRMTVVERVAAVAEQTGLSTEQATIAVELENRRQAVSVAREHDQLAKLQAQGVVSHRFPTMEDLANGPPENSTTPPFFLARNAQGFLVLYAYVDILVDTEEGKKKRFILLPMTEQPFFAHSYVAGMGERAVVINYIRQYAGGRPEWAFITIDAAELAEPAGRRAVLSRLGVSEADAGNSFLIEKHMHTYIKANLGHLRRKPVSAQVDKRLGFQFLEGQPVYAQGSYLAKADGTVDAVVLGPRLEPLRAAYEMPFMSSDALRAYKGDAYTEVILPHARQYAEGIRNAYVKDGCELFQISWLLGICSPYLAFVTDEVPSPLGDTMPGMGIALSLYSAESGYGKTSLQSTIAHTYGEFDRNKSGGSEKTGISVIATGLNLAARGSLPFSMDETSNNEADTVSELIHKISQGRDKMRATQTGRIAEHTGTWTSVTVMSTNVSQRMKLSEHRSASDAEQMRVVEVNFDAVDRSKLDFLEFTRIFKEEITPHTGALGMVLGRYAVMNWDTMLKEANSAQRAVVERFGLTQGERFFVRIFAAALLALGVMRKHGLDTVDPVVIDSQMKRIVTELRSYLDDNTVTDDDLASRMLVNFFPRVVRTRTETDGRKGNLPGTTAVNFDVVENAEIINRVKIAGRYVDANQRLYLSSSEFGTWLSKLGYDRRAVLMRWAKAGLYTPGGKDGSVQKRLNAGVQETIMPETRMRVYQFNLSNIKYDVDQLIAPGNVIDIGTTTSQSQSAQAGANQGASHAEQN